MAVVLTEDERTLRGLLQYCVCSDARGPLQLRYLELISRAAPLAFAHQEHSQAPPATRENSSAAAETEEAARRRRLQARQARAAAQKWNYSGHTASFGQQFLAPDSPEVIPQCTDAFNLEVAVEAAWSAQPHFGVDTAANTARKASLSRNEEALIVEDLLELAETLPEERLQEPLTTSSAAQLTLLVALTERAGDIWATAAEIERLKARETALSEISVTLKVDIGRVRKAQDRVQQSLTKWRTQEEEAMKRLKLTMSLNDNRSAR